ncbi:hypothetical protein QBC36DRAFT_78087 [Triangularia setosa]|uniref:NACHT domain-containing protein n=1 Tax=Triangularia setosa TaxID=2587417 RepID=A0AAN7A3V4_9PEZI|nr:hypothetical protein QBC36DRAFT_78087 [Podospora setosa]
MVRIDFKDDCLNLVAEEHERDRDRKLMEQRLKIAVESGLKKTEEWARAMEVMGNISSAISQVGNIIQSTLSATVPQAGVAWLGVSVLLKGLCNAAQQSIENREGIIYVGSRANWYQGLFSIRDKMAENTLEKLRKELEQGMVNLFSLILAYQMRSVGYYYRGRLSTTLFDSFTTKAGWDDQLGVIKSSEQVICQCVDQYDRKAGLEFLARLTDTARNLESEMKAQFTKIDVDKLVGKFSVSGLNYEEFMDRNPNLTEGTCRWFFDEHRVKDWEDGSQKLLLITAMPGQGKSVLARSLVHQWRADKKIVCHFFFKDTNKIQKSVTMALCAILHQVLKQDSSLALNVEKTINQEGEALIGSTARLWNLLEAVTSNVSVESSPIICILDALDECDDEDRRLLLQKITTYCKAESDQHQKPKLKILLTSRPIDDINLATYDAPRITLDPNEDNPGCLSNEIDIVIDKWVDKMGVRKAWSEKLRMDIKRELKTGGNQLTYLWLRVVFELLEKARVLLPRDWIRLIRTLPPTVNDAYEELLKRIEHRERVKDLLSIMLCAYRPLEVGEISVALGATICGDQALEDSDVSVDGDFRAWINSHCGFFIQIYENKVQFIHQTAKEFLMERPKRPSEKTEWQGMFTIETTHQRMRDLCCRYLADRTRYWRDRELRVGTEYLDWFHPDGEEVKAIDCFIPYAIQYRQFHNDHCGLFRDDELRQEEVSDFTSRSSPPFPAPLASVRSVPEKGTWQNPWLWAHMYAYECLEALKQSCSGHGLYTSDGQLHNHHNASAADAKSILNEKTKQFVRHHLYPDGNITKDTSIRVSKLYYVMKRADVVYVIMEHVTGDTLAQASETFDPRRDAQLKHIARAIALFLCFPTSYPLDDTQPSQDHRSPENSWRQVEAMLRDILTNFTGPNATREIFEWFQ